jgi:hypothetical protein
MTADARGAWGRLEIPSRLAGPDPLGVTLHAKVPARQASIQRTANPAAEAPSSPAKRAGSPATRRPSGTDLGLIDELGRSKLQQLGVQVLG